MNCTVEEKNALQVYIASLSLKKLTDFISDLFPGEEPIRAPYSAGNIAEFF